MGLDPAPFRVTEATVHRAARDGFDPHVELDAALHEALRRIERADQELRHRTLDGAAARRLVEDALTRNVYGTASIEGNPLTLAEVESLLARGPTPDNQVRPHEREIVNLARHLESLDARPAATDADGVRALHEELFDGVLDDAGSFKATHNFIGHRPSYEVLFVPAAPERVGPELDSALAWHADAGDHPLVRAAAFFHEFQSIHPFRDGNGRVGRALLHQQLHQAGYPGVRYALVDYTFNEDREAYYGALRTVDREPQDHTPWVRYLLGVLADTFEDANRRFLFRDALPDDLNARQVQVAEWFARLARDNPRREVKFNDVHAAFPQIADRTLKRDLKRLREGGVVVMHGERKAARYSFTA